MNLDKKAALFICRGGCENPEDNGKHITYANLENVDRKSLKIRTNQGDYEIKVPIIGQNVSSIVLDKSKYGVGVTLGTSDCCWGYIFGFIIGQDEEGKFGCGMRYAQQLNLNPRDIVPVNMKEKNHTGELVIGSACSGKGVRLIVRDSYGRSISSIQNILASDETPNSTYLERLKVSKEGISIVEPKKDLTEKLISNGVDIRGTLENIKQYERFTNGQVMKEMVKSNPEKHKRLEQYIKEYDLVDKTGIFN